MINEPVINQVKICSSCNEEKPLSEIYFRKVKGKYYRGECRDCERKSSEDYRKSHKNEIKVFEDAHKEEKSAYNKIHKKQYYQDNKEKVLVQQKGYRENHKEEIKENRKQYRKDHKEEIAEYQKQYRINNKKDILEYKNEWEKQKKQTDPVFKLHKTISHLVRSGLKREGSSKKRLSILEYLWSSYFEDLKKHLEELFDHSDNLVDGKPWMTWDNWTIYDNDTWDDNDPTTWTWQLDHIIPRSDLPSFSMEDENFKKCWAFENLRPLSAKQNCIDGARRTRHNKNKKEK